MNSLLRLIRLVSLSFVALTLFSILSVSSLAYGYNVVTGEDGITQFYEFIYDDEPTSMSVKTIVDGSDLNFTRSMLLQMNFRGAKVTQGGSWLITSTMDRIGKLYTPYNDVDGYNLLNVYSSDLPNISGSTVEKTYAQCSFTTSFPELSLNGNIKLTLKYYTLLPEDYNVASRGQSYYITDSLLKESSTMYLTVYDGLGEFRVLTLYPSYAFVDTITPNFETASGEGGSNDSGWFYHQVEVTYLLSSEDFNYKMNKINCNLVTWVGRSFDTDRYYQQQLYVDNVRLEFVDSVLLEGVTIGNSVNDDLIRKLGVINEFDQEKINYVSVQNYKLNNVNQQVSQMTSFETELRNDFDVSYKPDVLTDTAVISTVESFWDILPLENEFFLTVFGMVGSIALLSLILHSTARGVFTHGGGSHSSSNSYKQKNNKNKDGD